MHTSPPFGSRIIGIDGRSGSGKSRLALDLASRVPRARVLALEESYLGWHGLVEGVAHVVEHALAPLAAGRPGRYRSWDWLGDRPGPWVELAPLAEGEVLIVEGCGAISDHPRPYLDHAIWCEAPETVRRARALARDPYDWAARWDEWAAQENLLAYSREPDEVIDTSGDREDVGDHHQGVGADPLGGGDLEQNP